jgi:hypothetical protein
VDGSCGVTPPNHAIKNEGRSNCYYFIDFITSIAELWHPSVS